MKKIVITAANGFLGKGLIQHIRQYYPDCEIHAIVRKQLEFSKEIKVHLWDGKTIDPWQICLENADLLVNFAGKSVDCRYNEKNKAAIFSSRLESTKVLSLAIQNCKNPPKIWINAASATIYAHSLDKANTEIVHNIGEGFSVEVCKAWEKVFFETPLKKTHQIALRTTIVLGKNGGVFPVLKKLTKRGLGGRMGKGNQRFSWIHETDYYRLICHLGNKKSEQKIINGVAPEVVTNATLQAILRTHLKQWFHFPVPKWLLKIGARFIKTESELVLKSRFIQSEIIKELQFSFEFPTLDETIKDLV